MAATGSTGVRSEEPSEQWCQRLWPGVWRAGLPRLSPPLTPGQRRRQAPP
jgi:hypothetical protein